MFAVCAPKVILLVQRLVAKAERLEDVREAIRHGQTSVVGSGGWVAGAGSGAAVGRCVGRGRLARGDRLRSSRRRRIASIAITPPIEVVARIIRWTSKPERERVVARDAEALGDPDDRQLERPDEAGPGRDDRDQRHAAREQGRLRQRQLDADRLAGGKERAGRGGPGEGAEGECRHERSRPAGDGEALAQPCGRARGRAASAR